MKKYANKTMIVMIVVFLACFVVLVTQLINMIIEN